MMDLLIFDTILCVQQVWDVIRTVRCLWEGNLNKALSIALNIGMLNQEVVTFSGDTATARLDIQVIYLFIFIIFSVYFT